MALKDKPLLVPDYLLETSWEVCNKIGGIYTAIATKANLLAEELKDNYILIGPDVWKETHQNPEFIEDKFLFKSWREAATAEGLRIKVGRWNIPGKPAVILIDFTPYFPEKDKIFAHFWEHYKLDSLSGDWDYVEPALFGYAAGKVIESFYNFNISYHDKIVAQFHDWVTGTGILYLKEYLPQVGTVFTAHATVVGRTIAANGLPLYKNLENYGAEAIARQFGVAANIRWNGLPHMKPIILPPSRRSSTTNAGSFLKKRRTGSPPMASMIPGSLRRRYSTRNVPMPGKSSSRWQAPSPGPLSRKIRSFF